MAVRSAPGTVAMDQINNGLAVQNRAVDERIHFRQRFVHGQAQQIAFHFCGTLYPLDPAIGAVGIAVRRE